MTLQNFFDKCEDHIEVGRGIDIDWSMKGFGFGQLRVYEGADGKLHIANECMSKKTIKRIFDMMVDQAVLDDDREEKNG